MENRSITKEKQITDKTNKREEKVLTNPVLLILQFYDASISTRIRLESDMRHGKLSQNPISNGGDKVPWKFEGTVRAGKRAEGGEI